MSDCLLHEECLTMMNWAALAEEYAAEVGYVCDCGRPLDGRRRLFLTPVAGWFRVQGYAERQDVMIICKCGRVHRAREVLAIDRYAPRRPRNLMSRVKGLLCAAEDALKRRNP